MSITTLEEVFLKITSHKNDNNEEIYRLEVNDLDNALDSYNFLENKFKNKR